MEKAYVPDPELERKMIVRKYRDLLGYMYDKTTAEQKKLIRKAFTLAVNAHKDMRRRSGEPYIYHPIAVAKIVTQEINLGTTSLVCALLHDVVEDTNYSFEDLQEKGVDEEIVDALRLLTHTDDLSYEDYVNRIAMSGNSIAILNLIIILYPTNTSTKLIQNIIREFCQRSFVNIA